MKQQVNFSQFIDAFRDYGRHDQFTYQAKRALFDWIEEMDDDCGTESELDVVALCCEFSEHADAVTAALEYTNTGVNAMTDDDDKNEAALEFLRDNTHVIEFDGGILIASF
mgnify:CR=1 FL=1|tara:strand:- start:70 stop:402 length:333 start_codon:yes stop_codon:yes gene_type:complete